ncbi:MAG: TIM barrel protein [Gammaproteobacteria bacterium]|nr:TIM barrel protein [Gammaproteobacteria bacterium]
MKWSANLGFLWQSLELPSSIEQAAKAGFNAVEFHWPYQYSSELIAETLSKHQIELVSLNTPPGRLNQGEFGLLAHSSQELARSSLDQAIAYAQVTHCKQIHLMPGKFQDEQALARFEANIRTALEVTEGSELTFLIEPLNSFDVDGYLLGSGTLAVDIIKRIDDERLKLMFDGYHIQKIHGNLCHWFSQWSPYIGHVQIASVPKRTEPNQGEVDYRYLIDHMLREGYEGYVGLEYKPTIEDDASVKCRHALEP